MSLVDDRDTINSFTIVLHSGVKDLYSLANYAKSLNDSFSLVDGCGVSGTPTVFQVDTDPSASQIELHVFLASISVCI